ncbi:MAG: glycosyltransferase family 2 protein [Candidatus Methanomethylicia archaeon]
MNFPKVSIIILNWNGWKDTIECLESLYRIDYPNYDVIVIDNGSIDESVEMIKKYCLGEIKVKSKFFKYNASNKPIKVFEILEENLKHDFLQFYESYEVNKRIILIRNKKNYGFAKGNNIGIKFALEVLNPEFVLLLNNDTVVSEDFLNELVKFAKEGAEIVGPKIYYYDYNGRSDVISFIGEDMIPWKGIGFRYGCEEVDKGQWDKPLEIDRVEGSCMLIKKDVFKRVGFFDEVYFFFYEETDFCIKAKKTGFKIKYCPTAKVWHKVSKSIGKESFMKIYFLTKNRVIFIKKNFPSYLWKHFLYIIFYEFWFRGGKFILYKRRPKLFLYYLKGLIDGYKAIHKL